MQLPHSSLPKCLQSLTLGLTRTLSLILNAVGERVVKATFFLLTKVCDSAGNNPLPEGDGGDKADDISIRLQGLVCFCRLEQLIIYPHFSSFYNYGVAARDKGAI